MDKFEGFGSRLESDDIDSDGFDEEIVGELREMIGGYEMLDLMNERFKHNPDDWGGSIEVNEYGREEDYKNPAFLAQYGFNHGDNDGRESVGNMDVFYRGREENGKDKIEGIFAFDKKYTNYNEETVKQLLKDIDDCIKGSLNKEIDFVFTLKKDK